MRILPIAIHVILPFRLAKLQRHTNPPLKRTSCTLDISIYINFYPHILKPNYMPNTALFMQLSYSLIPPVTEELCIGSLVFFFFFNHNTIPEFFLALIPGSMKLNCILIFEIENCECSMEAVKNTKWPFELSATGNQSH